MRCSRKLSLPGALIILPSTAMSFKEGDDTSIPDEPAIIPLGLKHRGDGGEQPVDSRKVFRKLDVRLLPLVTLLYLLSFL